MNQYWWGNINKSAENAYIICPACPKYNPGKPVCTAPRHFKLPNGPLKFWQMDFTQLSPSHGYKYVLVIVCMFSHWTEAFLCRQATASSMVKVILEKAIFTWGIALELYSDTGTHFAGQKFWQICTIWQHFHCAYHPQISDLVKHINCFIKTQLEKSVEALQLPLPLLLLNLRSITFGTQNLSPFEIVTGCQMHLVPSSFDSQLIKGETLQYCKNLITF